MTNKRVQLDALIALIVEAGEEGITVVAMSVDYDAGRLTVEVGEASRK